MRQHFGFTVALKRVWLWSLLLGGYASLTMFKDAAWFPALPDIPGGLDAAASFAMGMLLVFRTNRAYERWWEARTQWGTLVNVSRNLAVKVRELVAVDAAEKQRFAALIVAYSEALMDHLRDDLSLPTLAPYHSGEAPPEHPPSFLVRRIYAAFHRWQSEGRLSEQMLWILDRESRVLLDVCGACERIKNTLMAQSWRLFTRQCVFVYLLLLPWGLHDDFHYWTIPLTVVIAYFVIGGEGIAHYAEQPFGSHEDHLDLQGICANIKSSVNEVLS